MFPKGGLPRVALVSDLSRSDIALGSSRTEGNARLTAATGVVIFVLLALEGVTILSVARLIKPHVFIGMLLVPPVLVKLGSTFYRFAMYYTGHPGFREKGPPPAILRLAGPFVALSTVAVLGTGIALLYAPAAERPGLLTLHKVSFVLWFAVMTLHVVGHILDTARLAPRDYTSDSRMWLRGAPLRRLVLAASVVAGVVLGLVSLGPAGTWVR